MRLNVKQRKQNPRSVRIHVIKEFGYTETEVSVTDIGGRTLSV